MPSSKHDQERLLNKSAKQTSPNSALNSVLTLQTRDVQPFIDENALNVDFHQKNGYSTRGVLQNLNNISIEHVGAKEELVQLHPSLDSMLENDVRPTLDREDFDVAPSFDIPFPCNPWRMEHVHHLSPEPAGIPGNPTLPPIYRLVNFTDDTKLHLLAMDDGSVASEFQFIERRLDCHLLERWAYETSDSNLTFAERLEKSNWESTRMEKL